jgi:hypothetical protein
MQPLNHSECQRTLSSQNLINSILTADNRDEVVYGETLLLHSEFNGLNRIREVDGIMLPLTSFIRSVFGA